MQQYWIYCLGDDETAESLGEDARYIINASGSFLTNGWYQSPTNRFEEKEESLED